MIDWASRKLSEAEKKYTITEKEFMAMAWSIEHFEYYLKGKKFKVITDHSALVSSQIKHIFGNLKLERMRERIQKYDFTIEYKKGTELVDADTISRIYEGTKVIDPYNIPKNVLIDSKGVWYYKMEDNSTRQFPDVHEKESLVKEAHEEETCHGGRDATIYNLKQKYYWPKLNETVSNYIRNCIYCQANCQKTDGGEIYIETNEPLEKFGIDLMFIEQDIPVLVCIDYFTRKLDARILKNKETKTVMKEILNIFETMGKPTQIITDNGKEFCSKDFEKYCSDNKIEIHRTSAGKHQGNGRVERLNRTIWQAIRKTLAEHPEIKLDDCIDQIVRKLNNTYHRGIGCTPTESWERFNKEKGTKDPNKKYETEFVKLHREKFEIDEEVLVEDLNTKSKAIKANSKYTEKGIIVRCLDNDTYMVKMGNKVFKRNHANIKKF